MQQPALAPTELLTQAIQAIGKVLAVQQQQGAHQQEWIQRNAALFKMPRMTREDDPEAYIEAFERTAIQTGLDRGQWGHHLRALVIDQAQAAYRALSRDEARDYETVKAAILYRLEISPESHRQAFRARKSKEARRPRGLLQALRDSLNKWLPAGKFDRAGVMDQILLEQFLWDLEEDAQRWVRRHQTQTSKEALHLAEAFANSEGEQGYGRGSRGTKEGLTSEGERRTVSRRGPPKGVVCYRCGQTGHISRDCGEGLSELSRTPTGYPPSQDRGKEAERGEPMNCSFGSATQNKGWNRPVVTAWVGDRVVKATLDTGCSHSLLRADLAPQRERKSEGPLTMTCILGEMRFQTCYVPLRVMEFSGELRVGIAPTLACEMILGREWSPFYTVLERVRATQEARNRIKRGDGWAGEGPARRNETVTGDIDLEQFVSAAQFRRAQHEDSELQRMWDADPGEGPSQGRPGFEVTGGLLYRVQQGEEGTIRGRQLVVPTSLRQVVWRLAHDSPLGGHLGRNKTWARLAQEFFWPRLQEDVERSTCPECQRAQEWKPPRAPLKPMPIVETPFSRVALDIVGPLPRSHNGYQYILVMVDYTTRFPDAVPLRSITATQVAEELLKWIARVGIPREILTDQGTNFMSGVMKALCKTLGITQLKTSVYHPQTNSLVERLNGTIKRMLRRCAQEDPRRWDTILTPLLFAIRDVPQESTQYSPFQLVYSHSPRGLLQIVREEWEKPIGLGVSAERYQEELQDRISTAQRIARQNLRDAQGIQERGYNQKAKTRTFQSGDKVLVSLPTSSSKQLAMWQGPFTVVRQVGPMDYELLKPGHRRERQVYHVNLFREWKTPQGWLALDEDTKEDLGPLCPGLGRSGKEGSVQMGKELGHHQQQELLALIEEFRAVFQEIPGQVTGVEHEIRTPQGALVRERWRPIPQRWQQEIRQEIMRMQEQGIIRPSRSPWRSPIVPVIKPDRSLRVCIDYRKLNALTTFDAFPMPHVTHLVEKIGEAQYITTLDLAKGYWQIPMRPTDCAKTAFGTPWGLFEFTRMPFGLNGAAATFQRLMDNLLAPHAAYATAYIDDIIIFSASWRQHLQDLRAVLGELRAAGLTANPKKCKLAGKETAYLGFRVGRGTVRPLADKIEAIRQFQEPRTRKQLRSFLGLVNYYRRFIPCFATLATPLTDALAGKSVTPLKWTPGMRKSFQNLKEAMRHDVVVHTPNFNAPFILQTDASGWALGAVLLQKHGQEERPIAFASRKLSHAETSDCNMSSTRIMDSKLREAEGFGEDNSGKKKSKFKSFKKFFGKRKRKETLPSMGTSRLKPCQSTSDVMASESAHISYDSEDELENHKGVMGSRALSHDSIFIPEAAQEPCRRVRVFSQENISDRIRTLQLKLQHNLKLGPPPPPSGILVKRVDDAGASSEDDGLPRSPPEMSLIHEVLGSNTTRFSDSHKHLSSLSLAGTGSEEEEQVTSGPSSRPRSTEGQLFPKHESAKTRSPRTSDSSISPAADFDTPPKYSTCLDNSAAKHKLLIKPRNQRSSRMQRFSLTQSESLNDLSCTPEEEEHDGREILTDLTDEILNTSHQDLSGSTAVTCDMPSLQRAEIPADFSYCLRQTDERPSSLQFTAESAIRQKVLLPENNPELCQTAQELTYLASDYPSPLEPKENSITWSGIQNREMQRERKCSETLNISMGNVYEVSNDIMNRENKQLPSVPLINKMLSEGDAPTHQDISSCLEGSKDKGQKDKISVETFCNMEEKRESAVFSGSCKQLPEGPSQHVSQSALSQAGACAAWSPEKKSIQEPAVSNEENNQSLIQRETILERKGEKAATGPIALRKFSVSSAWERPRTSSFHLKESSEYESLLNSRLSLPKPNLLQNEKSKEEVQMGSDLQERKSRNKMRALLPESDCEITGHAMDKMVSGCVSQVADETSMPGDSSLVSQHQSSCEDKNPFQVKLRSTSLSLKYGDSSSTEAKGIKRYSAEFNVDKEGLASFLKGEKAQIKTTTDVNISVSLNANQTPKAKSPEQLNTKPPLPKKPILQNITNSNKEKQENGIKSPESRNEDRDLEKKLSPPQVPEKSVPSLVMTADSGRRIDSESKPAWITIARQKQRGMQQEQELNTEEKLVVQDMKSETEKANQEKERTEGSVKQQTDSIRNKFSDSATTSEEQRKETKSDVKEPLPRASFLSHHVSEEISQCKKASHSAPDQPSWMELAKKKSQAWNDMPRIIK